MFNPHSVMNKILLEFPVLWEGWECDPKAWVMERPDGTRFLQMTSHGLAYEAVTSSLEDRIAEYERVLAVSREALALLTVSPPA